MPRPTTKRTKHHDRAPRAKQQDLEEEDGFGDSMMTDSLAGPSGIQTMEDEEEPAEPASARPVPKQKKADKLYAKREALIAKITAGRTPYSKSHERRLKRAKKPENNLVASLDVVEEALPELDVPEEDREDDDAPQAVANNGKGKEKLTAKKRHRVLEQEATRLPAVMSNAAFLKDPFATIRLHTLNTMKQMEATAPAKGKSKSK